MHIEHVAIWTRNLETLQAFYETYFGARAGDKYVNPGTGFESYALVFPSAGARLELMRSSSLPAPDGGSDPRPGYAHLAMSIGSPEAVRALTARLQADGFQVVNGPRVTGDGYYESAVLDPDGNRIEIVA